MIGLTPAVRAALPVAREALMGPMSAYGSADAIVFALSTAGLLPPPGIEGELAQAAEDRADLVARLAELEPYEALHPQECPNSQHIGWFAAGDNPLPCPWCRIAELEALAAAPVPAVGCSVPGCGSTAAYLDTSTQRTAGWVQVYVQGWAPGTARWFCTPICAARALGAGPAPVYVALSGDMLLGAYTASAAADAHCTSALRMHVPDVATGWLPDIDNPAVVDLVVKDRGHTSATGYRVLTCTPQAVYDPTGGA